MSYLFFYDWWGLLLPSAIAVSISLLFYYLTERTAFTLLPEKTKTLTIGICFGAVSILGSIFGVVTVGDGVANVRDVAPLCAGLLFNGPAGIIAGLIGGLWRWFSVIWTGSGAFTRLACSLSTVLAGFIAAGLRKWLFENKRPNWIFGLTIGVVIESMHMALIFLTNLSASYQAFDVVKSCFIPMLSYNGITIMLTALLISLWSDRRQRKKKRMKTLSEAIQTPLLILVILAFVITSIMVYRIQTNSILFEMNNNMSYSLNSLKQDIEDETDKQLDSMTECIAREIELDPNVDLEKLCKIYDTLEIYLTDENGIVTNSTEVKQIGKAMAVLTGLKSAKRVAVKLESGGSVVAGFSKETYYTMLRQQILSLSTERYAESGGLYFGLDENRRVISNDSEANGVAFSELALDDEIPGSQIIHVKKDVLGVFMMGEAIEDFTIILLVSDSEAFSSRDDMIYIYSLFEILIFAILFAVIYFIIKKYVVRDIQTVNAGLSKIIGGNLDTVIDVHSNLEISALSDDINSTVDTLKDYIKEAEKRIDEELAFAKSIQHSSLPSVFPAFPNQTDFDIYATMDTAKKVGGDFYDFYFIDKNKFAFMIADVSGKGIPAALFMMRAKTTIKALAESGLSVDEVFRQANNKLCESNDAEMFVTAWMGIADIKTGHVEFANAGHNPPVLFRKSQGPEYFKSRPGLVLAGIEGVQYRLQEMDLNPGDRLYLYTDGVTEATRTDGELYGEERLLSFIKDHGSMTAEQLLPAIKGDIDRFAGEAEQFDDITMLMFDYKK